VCRRIRYTLSTVRLATLRGLADIERLKEQGVDLIKLKNSCGAAISEQGSIANGSCRNGPAVEVQFHTASV